MQRLSLLDAWSSPAKLQLPSSSGFYTVSKWGITCKCGSSPYTLDPRPRPKCGSSPLDLDRDVAASTAAAQSCDWDKSRDDAKAESKVSNRLESQVYKSEAVENCDCLARFRHVLHAKALHRISNDAYASHRTRTKTYSITRQPAFRNCGENHILRGSIWCRLAGDPCSRCVGGEKKGFLGDVRPPLGDCRPHCILSLPRVSHISPEP